MMKYLAYFLVSSLTIICFFFNQTLFSYHMIFRLQTSSDDTVTDNVQESSIANGCTRAKRSSGRRIPCPYYFNVSLDATIYPSHKAELFCDTQQKALCRSQCVSKVAKTHMLKPRLQFLGYRVENGVKTYYYKPLPEEEFSAACLCI